MDDAALKATLEAMLLASDKPMKVEKLTRLLNAEQAGWSEKVIQNALVSLQADCEHRGVELIEVASGYRYQVKRLQAQRVSQLWEEKPPRYSRALLETLALIAYRQPITRADIEDVRGVSVSTNIIRTLLERDWIKVIGHRDVPGRPSLYATTKEFLDYFSLRSLDELPSLKALQDLDEINPELPFDTPKDSDAAQVQPSLALTEPEAEAPEAEALKAEAPAFKNQEPESQDSSKNQLE